MKKICIIEYQQRRNEIASYDDAEGQPVVLYKVGKYGSKDTALRHATFEFARL